MNTNDYSLDVMISVIVFSTTILLKQALSGCSVFVQSATIIPAFCWSCPKCWTHIKNKNVFITHKASSPQISFLLIQPSVCGVCDRHYETTVVTGTVGKYSMGRLKQCVFVVMG